MGARKKEAPPPPVEDDGASLGGHDDEDAQQPQQVAVTQQQPSAAAVPAPAGNIPPAPAENAVSAPSAAAKARQEEREEERRVALRGQYSDALGRLGARRSEYTLKLYRKNPEWQGKYRTAGLLETYEAGNLPTEQEIADKHGGFDYRCVLSGPNPDNPRENVDVSVFLQVAGFPTTFRHNGGLMPLPRDAFEVDKPSATTEVMELVRNVMDQNQKNTEALRKEMADMLAPKPVDPEALKLEQIRLKNEHEKELKRMELDADEKREERRKREKREDEEKAKERADRAEAAKLASEERQRQHDKEMKLLDLKAAEDKLAREEARKAAEALQKTIADAQKAMADQVAANAKMMADALSKLAEQKPVDPVKQLAETAMTMKTLTTMFTPEAPPPPEPPSQGMEIAKMILPKFMQTADKVLERLTPAEKKAPPPIKPGTVMRSPAPAAPAPRQLPPAPSPAAAPVAVEAAAAPAPVAADTPAAPAPAEPAAPVAAVRVLPEFTFPTEETDGASALKMLGENIATALQANMLPQAIFNHVVSKFRADVLEVVVGQPKDTALSMLQAFVPADSVLLTPRGQMTMKMLYSMVKATRK